MSGFDDDFSTEEPTPVMERTTMEELMESLRQETEERVHSPGIPTLTSERPTRPMRPMVVAREAS